MTEAYPVCINPCAKIPASMKYARIEIAPSILASNFARLGDEVRLVEEGGADVIHVDVMDGHFVPNISIGIPVVECLRKATRLPLDVHRLHVRPAGRQAISPQQSQTASLRTLATSQKAGALRPPALGLGGFDRPHLAI